MTTSQKKTNNTFNQSILPWVIWGVAASFFFFVYLVRVSPSVMTLDLMKDFETNATVIGVLMACFYYPYVAMQIPVGLLIDRFGAQKLLSIMSVFAAVSTLCFALSTNVVAAGASRILIGFAASFGFVGVIKLAAGWHANNKLGLIVGLTQSSAMFGAFCAVPLAKLNGMLGWRNTLMCLVLILFFIGLAIKKWAKPKLVKWDTVKSEPDPYTIWQSLGLVLKNPQTWYNAVFLGLFFAPTGVFAENWGIIFLQQAYNLPVEQAAMLNGLIFIGWIIGGPIIGWQSDKLGKRKPLMMLTNLLLFICLSIIVFVPNLPIIGLGCLLLFMGMVNSGVSVAYTLSTEINISAVSGTSLAFANMASVILGAMMLPIVGLILDNVDIVSYIDNVPVYSVQAFQYAFLPLIVGLACGMLVVMMIKDTHCKPLDR